MSSVGGKNETRGHFFGRESGKFEKLGFSSLLLRCCEGKQEAMEASDDPHPPF
jgi:hypothetical protein